MDFQQRIRRMQGIHILCLVTLVLFFFVVFLPPVYVLSYAFQSSFTLGETGVRALLNSFVIGGVVTAVDLALGLPVAWIMARRSNLRFRYLVDTLIDMPLVVPTSVLGLSVFYFWGDGMGALLGLEGGLVSKGPVLVALLHIVFTFPYVVRSIEAAVFQIDRSHEQAATMLGASPLTVFRTISLPLFKAGLVSGAILAFTRSLSETGATMMVAGVFSTAPTIVIDYKRAADIPSAASVSVVLIWAAIVLLLVTKVFSSNIRMPVSHVWPGPERSLSHRYVGLRDFLVSSCVSAVILLPTFYIALSGLGVVRTDTFLELIRDSAIINSILVSFAVGLIVTAVNLALAIPLGILISRDLFKAGGLVDTMSDIILLVPTSALGLSLGLFWGKFAFGDFWILVLAHLSFSFPLMVKPIAAALSGVSPNLEAAARTLGARQFRVFQTIVYPLIKPGIVAGVIMTFMRSLSETGATMSVTQNIKTIPVLLVDLFAMGRIDDKAILACVLLFLTSFILIIALKKMDVKNAKN